MKTKNFTLKLFFYLCLVMVALPLQSAQNSPKSYSSCGISFNYPASLRLKEVKPASEEEANCEFRLMKDTHTTAPYELSIIVYRLPLKEAMIHGGWENRSEEGDEEWIYSAYGIDVGKIEKVSGRTIITAEAGYNCGDGGSRSPGVAVSCDGLQGAVSNDKISVLVNSNLSGLTDAALQITKSLTFQNTGT